MSFALYNWGDFIWYFVFGSNNNREGVVDGTAYEQNMFAGFGLSCRSSK